MNTENTNPTPVLDSSEADMLELYDMAMNRDDILSADSSTSITRKLRSLQTRYGERKLSGKGGMKKVYRVEDLLTGRYVAMAVLSKGEDLCEQDGFLREARLTAALEHPNIMPVYDLGFNDQGDPFFTMKYTGDQNLHQLLKRVRPKKRVHHGQQENEWPLLERLNLFVNICEGMAYAHSRNILHLDLKPRNILVGNFGEVLICDWGLGKVLFEEESEEDGNPSNIDPVFFHEVSLKGAVKGTPGYMAPEQVDKSLGPRDQRTDIYALGGILHALLTGDAPITGRTTQEIFDKTVEGRFDHTPINKHHVPAPLEAVIQKALACQPGSRYQTVASLKQDILAYMGGFATKAENAGLFRVLFLMAKRYKIACGLALVLFLSSLVFMGYLYRSEHRTRNLLELYTTAKETHVQYRKEIVKELLALARQSQTSHVYKKTITYARQITYQEPTNKEAWLLMGEAHFYLQEFNAASKILSRVPDTAHGNMMQLAKLYGRKKADDQRLKPADLLTLLKSVDLVHKRHLFAKERLLYTDLDGHLKNVHYMLKETNPNQTDLHFNVQKTGEIIRLDLSGNTSMTDLYALKGLSLYALNLEGVPVRHSMAAINLQKIPLRELNIAETAIKRLAFLELFPDLETLTVSKGDFPGNRLKPIRKRMTVVEKPKPQARSNRST
jgi:hypothetical protein